MSTLESLRDLLRDQSKWPDDFEWDYSETTQCAIGLGCTVGLIKTDFSPCEVVHTDLDMDQQDFDNVFFTREPDTFSFTQVTPEMVAERIDEVLAR